MPSSKSGSPVSAGNNVHFGKPADPVMPRIFPVWIVKNGNKNLVERVCREPSDKRVVFRWGRLHTLALFNLTII